MLKKLSVVFCGAAVILMTAGNAIAQGDAAADAATTAAVKTKLLADTKVGGLGIDVDTKDNVVTLSGKVRTAAERTEAVRLARTTTGVKNVVSKLVVDPTYKGITNKDDRAKAEAKDEYPRDAKGTAGRAADKTKAEAKETKIEIEDDTKETAAKVKDATKKAGEKTNGTAQHRQRPSGREVRRAQLGRRAIRDRGGGGNVPERPRAGPVAARARLDAPSPPADHPPLNLAGVPGLDQLLGDRPRECLPGPGAASGPKPRAAAQGRPQDRVTLEHGEELGEVVVDPGGEPHPLDRELERLGLVVRSDDRCAKAHFTGRPLPNVDDHGPLASVEQSRHHALSQAHRPVHARAAREPVGPRRAHLDLERGGHAAM